MMLTMEISVIYCALELAEHISENDLESSSTIKYTIPVSQNALIHAIQFCRVKVVNTVNEAKSS